MIDPDLFMTEAELLSATGPFMMDVECYPNYFEVGFMDFHTGKWCFFERHDNSELQIDWIKWILDSFCVVGFNIHDYDIIVLSYALSHHSITCAQIKHISNEIITSGVRKNELQMQYMFGMHPANTVDLIEVAPLKGSLKTYAARLHCQHLEDLPYHHETVLTREEKNRVRNYNYHDLSNTRLLCNELSPHLELRAKFGVRYGKDFRSLSDAQMAEEIIASEIQKLTGKRPKKADFKKRIGEQFTFDAPAYISFQTPQLQELLTEIQKAVFIIGETGHVIRPKEIENRRVMLGDNAYTVGMGGLHSVEKTMAIISNSLEAILDRDVTGYYPNMMLKNKFFPKHLGVVFLEALQGIVSERTEAKRLGDDTTRDGLKIGCNGIFGKTSDPYSVVYDPKMMVQTTLTGQLSVLMLIERLTLSCFSVVSGNTDGIVTLVERNRIYEFESIIQRWEQESSLETEETEYQALYSRDVNNYIAVKMDGKVKQKGVYSYTGSALNSELSKNPVELICIDAVCALIQKGIPIDQTVRACEKIERFTSARLVAGGAVKDGRYLGRTVRWYYAAGVKGCITYATNGHKVGRTDGAKPCMILPAALPADIDYDKYIELSIQILEKIGYIPARNMQYSLL